MSVISELNPLLKFSSFRPVTIRNSNQCQFCTNTIHLDCDPRPECHTRLYVWRCALHVENYLDTYMLESASTYRRLKLWAKYTTKELNGKQIEKEFVSKIMRENEEAHLMQAAKALIDLKNSTPNQKSEPSHQFSHAEKRMLIFHKSMFCTGKITFVVKYF